MSIRIVVSDGDANNTKVYDTETGKALTGVTRVEIFPFVADEFVKAQITFERVELDVAVAGEKKER